MTNSKKVLITIMSAICLLTVLSFTSFPDNSNKFIMIRSFESPDKLLSSRLIVTDGEKTLKNLDLEASRDKNFESNAMKITSVLNEYKSQGYRLVSMSGSLDAFGLTTFILEKN